MLAACGGGVASRTYTRAQAKAIASRCVKDAGATGVVQWGYVMSGSKVADVYFTPNGTVSAGEHATLDACLKPYGWSLGS